MASMDRPTLLDVAVASDPDGKIAAVVEIFNQTNPILQDAPALASNAPMGNRVTLRKNLPTVGWSKINQGYTRSKSTTRQVVDTIGLLAGRSEVDSRLSKIVGQDNFNAERRLQDHGFLEAMAQEIAGTMFYGNELTAESEFTGLQPRLATANTGITESQVAKHHSSPSGSDYTSIYVIDWHPDYVHLIYPKNTTAGLDVRNLGEQSVYDADSKPFQAYVMVYEWLIGLTVKDPRHIGRLANIDVSQALTDTSTLIKTSLTALINGMPPKNGANRVLYCGRDILTAFENQLDSKSNVMFQWGEYLNEKVLHFKGYPIRTCDQISVLETAVS
jgi:hypothetical protein